ncbi:MAG: hypothetical protein F6J89_03180 [Symploca sp. SIO1C4]|uniref:Uncharacterized protein n=1 Tax=Symploca sp. SIO1C4 TaxID=2607765 RepID=A0A6B3N979_9CYAN|nr:hypothetical protein [Symploca sp. SIO1C4]NET06252.1 hypothetical protein [Symploca sp. SIO2B6]NET54170.1 hypothetical protein [Merismopedia sp. SIO2A8]
MKEIETQDNRELQQLYLYIYLVPVIGCFPALWTLYRRRGKPEQQAASRLSLTLAFIWLLSYTLLLPGVYNSQLLMLRLYFLNTILTSGYFLVSFGLMVRLWQRQSLRIPGISSIAEGIVRKHLS